MRPRQNNTGRSTTKGSRNIKELKPVNINDKEHPAPRKFASKERSDRTKGKNINNKKA